jgi:hypothetical protein
VRDYDDEDYPIIKKPRRRFFPHDGDRRSELHWNDPDDELNLRRFHGNDPLKDGYDPPPADEDPLESDPGPDKIPDDIPIDG